MGTAIENLLKFKCVKWRKKVRSTVYMYDSLICYASEADYKYYIGVYIIRNNLINQPEKLIKEISKVRLELKASAEPSPLSYTGNVRSISTAR